MSMGIEMRNYIHTVHMYEQWMSCLHFFSKKKIICHHLKIFSQDHEFGKFNNEVESIQYVIISILKKVIILKKLKSNYIFYRSSGLSLDPQIIGVTSNQFLHKLILNRWVERFQGWPPRSTTVFSFFFFKKKSIF
jgi:hypothetical protein